MRPYTWTKGSTPPEDRIRARLAREYGQLDPDACWIWPGAQLGGYGSVITGSRTDGSRRPRLTHVLLWEEINGPTPEGLELHHRCMIELCCNPTHLKPVTHQVNCTLVTEDEKQARRDRLAYARSVQALSRRTM